MAEAPARAPRFTVTSRIQPGRRHPLSMEALPMRRRFPPLHEMLERRFQRLPSWRRAERQEWGG